VTVDGVARGQVRLGRVAGFPVSVNWSVLVIMTLLTWSLAVELVPTAAPDASDASYWAAGVIGAVLFMSSLLAHEVAHSIVARREGVAVEGLTLWLFGGIATLGGEPPSPGADFRIAIAGPATSTLLGVLYGALAGVLMAVEAGDVPVAVASWLAGINVLLAFFNLVPGAPLDGGRVLRSYLWHRHGDRTRATVSAAHAGRYVAFTLIALGLLEFLLGAGVGGLWLVFIGWFVLGAAQAERDDALAQRFLRAVRVGDAMTAGPVTCPAHLAVDEFIERYLFGRPHSAYPVVGPGGQIVGLVTLAQLRSVPDARRATTYVEDVAVPRDELVTASPDEPLIDLAPRLQSASGGRALVFDDGRLVGIVTRADIAHVLQARAPAQARATYRPPPPPPPLPGHAGWVRGSRNCGDRRRR
jgi:Zn-dependent protease/predicted transcriptional regulator